MSTKHVTTHRKHTTHTVHHKTHAAHAVATRHNAAAAPRPFESLGTAIEDMLDFPVLERNVIDMPPVDIRETGKTIEVSMALSGVEKKDIHLDLTEDSLAIFCESGAETNERNAKGYRFQEQSYGRFYRSFALPAAVKTDDAKAAYRNGVLTVTMYKQYPDRTRQLTVE